MHQVLTFLGESKSLCCGGCQPLRVHSNVDLQVTAELVAAAALILEDRVESLDVGIHVRRLRRNPLVDELQFIACSSNFLATNYGPLSVLTFGIGPPGVRPRALRLFFKALTASPAVQDSPRW